MSRRWASMVRSADRRDRDIDYKRAALSSDNGLGVSVCAAMGPDRDLIHPDKAIRDNGMAYIQPLHRRGHDAGRHQSRRSALFGGGAGLAADRRRARQRYRICWCSSCAVWPSMPADKGAVLCVEPLNRFETSFINLASQAIEVVDRVDHPACQIMLDTFHMNIEEQSIGDAIRRRVNVCAHLHTCENDRGAPGSRACAVERSRRCAQRYRLQRSGRDRVVHQQSQEHRPRRCDLASVWRPARTRWRRTD